MATVWLWLGLVWAGVDGHGPIPPPADGDPGRPLRSAGGERFDGGSVAVVGEYAAEPVNLFVDNGSRIRVQNLVEDIGIANLQIAHGFGPVGVGLVLPVAPWVSGVAGQTPALIDPELSVALGVLDGKNGGLSVVPRLRVPTTGGERFLGNSGVSGGGVVAGTLVVGGFHGTVNAGAEGRQVTRDAILEVGGTQILGSGSLGWVFEEPGIGVHAEWVGAYGLWGTTGITNPMELSGTVRGVVGSGWWTVGGGAGLNEGIGSSAFRLFAGGGVRWGRPAPEVVPEAVVDAPEEPVSVAAVSEVEWTVRDVRGAPVDAAIRAVAGDAVIEVAAADGRARLSLPEGTWEVSVVAEGFGSQRRELAVDGGPIGIEAILLEAAGDGSLSIDVAAVEGGPVPGARVLVDGLPAGTVGPGTLALDGLEPGEHAIEVQAHGRLGWTGFVGTGSTATVALHPVEGTLRVVVTDAAGARRCPTPSWPCRVRPGTRPSGSRAPPSGSSSCPRGRGPRW